jgi:hypothetical protein
MQMQSTILVSLLVVVLGGCGGTQFQGVDDSTLPDAGSSVPEVDAAPPLPPLVEGGSADVRAGGDASGSVEASTDAAAPDVAPPMGPDAGSDATGDGADAPWPSDVVVEPYCPDSELFPTYSVTCDTWGQAHGWTIQGCCLSDHTCGTVWDVPRQDLPPTRSCRR